MSTIKDVSKRTGLSLATISKYLNGGNVREKNRRVIDEAESGMTAVRVGSRLAMILSLLNRGEEAQALVERVREAWPESPWLIHLESTTP